MAHQRKTIRYAITSALMGETAAGARVYPTRVLPYQIRLLPVIAVYVLDEDSDAQSTAPRELFRSLKVRIECLVAPGPNVDDSIDDLAEEVEAAMNADQYFGGACVDSELKSTAIESIEDGDREIGFVALDYLVTYRTDAYCEPVGPDDFNEANATYNLNSATHVDERAEDQIIVQE